MGLRGVEAHIFWLILLYSLCDGQELALEKPEKLFSGATQLQCDQNICLNDGTCYATKGGSFSCVCAAGCSGTICERCEVVNPCSPNPCVQGGTCIPVTGNNYRCLCPAGRAGPNCELQVGVNPCNDVICQPGQRCQSNGPITMCVPVDNTLELEPPALPIVVQSQMEIARNALNNSAGFSICDERPCYNMGICYASSKAPGFTCQCQNGWKGERCEVDVKECLIYPCLNAATCIEKAGGFSCICADGFYGDDCSSELNECSSSPCANGGSCTDLINDYQCQCSQGWTGEQCETHMNACNPNPCMNNAACSTNPPSQIYNCTCLPGFSGNMCQIDNDDCIGVVCPQPGQICVDGVQSHRCVCPDGWTGAGCKSNVDECSLRMNLCQNDGTCVDTAGNFTCMCTNGFTGRYCETDIDECTLYRPCKYGICKNSLGSYSCYCHAGFVGDNCTENFDDCSSSPCHNEGVCVDSAHSFVCLCRSPYTGPTCHQTVDDCLSNPCQNNATCQSNLIGYDCLCQIGFAGRHCDLIQDPCLSSPCGPGHCSSFSDGSYNCDCVGTGYIGRLCDSPMQSEQVVGDMCDRIICENNGTCEIDERGQADCVCHEGYAGTNCEFDAPECLSFPCANGGTCLERSKSQYYTQGLIRGSFAHNNAAGYVCLCPAGLTGPSCSETIDSCNPNPCQNNGMCRASSTQGYTCSCPPGFTGYDCHVDINECTYLDSPCQKQNTRSCVNTEGSYRCECKLGWAGNMCEVELVACLNQPCPPTQLCIPSLTESTHTHSCHCESGRAGEACNLETTASFQGDSMLAVVSNPPPPKYTMNMQLRTTVPGTVIISGDDILGSNVFSLFLDIDGNIRLLWTHMQVVIDSGETGVSLVDGEWHGIRVEQEGINVQLQLISKDRSGIISSKQMTLSHAALAIFSSKFGGSRNLQSNSEMSDMKNFIGCIRDVTMNSEPLIPEQHLRSSINVQKGCSRVEPCANNPCGANGTCVDRWFTFECSCHRPFLPPTCKNSIMEATFGYENNRSYAQVLMTSAEKEDLKMDTNISMIVRTTQENGAIAFIGSQANVNSELDTFMSVELIRGQLSGKFKLGGIEPQIFIGGKRIDDGETHLIQVFRHDNFVMAKVDDEKVFDGELNHPFAHPLLVSHVMIGGYPPLPMLNGISKKRYKRQTENNNFLFNAVAFTTSKTFKGTIQDVMLNGKHIIFFPTPGLSVAQFGRTTLHNNVLDGTISDETCKSNPCMNSATCVVTFNDFKCMCIAGWRGKTCDLEDQCAKSGVCPAESQCLNTETGFICVTPTTFEANSYAAVSLQNFSHSVDHFWSLSFKLRTRSLNGNILSISGRSHNFLQIYLENGGLNINYQLQMSDAVQSQLNSNISRMLQLNDGKWHSVSLSMLTEKPHVTIDENDKPILLNGRPTVSLSQLFQDGGTVTFGNVPQSLSFKGCLDKIQFGTINQIAPVSLLESQFFGEPRMPHFMVDQAQDLQFRQCRGDEVCGADNLVGDCQNGATCTNKWNEFACNCLPGFLGQYCQINIDDCVSHECIHGECVDLVQDYSCACEPGYTGSRCERDINECQSSPCLNGGTCSDLLNQFACNCPKDYTGEMCEVLITVDCESNPCQNSGTCADSIDNNGLKTFNCTCVPGYEGKTCDMEIDYCHTAPCLMGSTCQSMTNMQDYQCQCALGYSGRQCDIDINDCAVNPCLNGGRCTDAVANFTCVCPQGWTSHTCGEDINECDANPCHSAATCMNTPGNYTCQCAEYHFGPTCEIAGTCLTNPCFRGTCLQPTPVEHQCQCPFGWSGTECTVEIDFCTSSPCRNSASCVASFGKYDCQCLPGFTGTNCEVDIDECASSPCVHGICVDQVDSYYCNCNGTGFTGGQCNLDVNECDHKSNCRHGTCTNTPGNYDCVCHQEYLGEHCNHRDPCAPRIFGEEESCKNGAKCVASRVEIDMYMVQTVKHDCVCMDDFEGQFCETRKERISSAAGNTQLVYIIAPIVGVLLLLCLIACISFVMVARQKRATRGTYSPSRQEISGARVQMGPMMKPPPEERLI